jgi:hypothetical protein
MWYVPRGYKRTHKTRPSSEQSSFVPRGYKRTHNTRPSSEESSFRTPTCRDVSLGAEEWNLAECSELAAANGKKGNGL